MRTLCDGNNPILRSTAAPVPEAAITSPHIQELLRDMSAVLATREDGVALAAPQVGESLRIFIVSGKIFETTHTEALPHDLVFINPTLVSHTHTEAVSEEGCLSVPNKYGSVSRYTEATIEAYDAQGVFFTMKGSGLLAQIFQHELDHLDGVLYIDKATTLEDISQSA